MLQKYLSTFMEGKWPHCSSKSKPAINVLTFNITLIVYWLLSILWSFDIHHIWTSIQCFFVRLFFQGQVTCDFKFAPYSCTLWRSYQPVSDWVVLGEGRCYQVAVSNLFLSFTFCCRGHFLCNFLLPRSLPVAVLGDVWWLVGPAGEDSLGARQSGSTEGPQPGEAVARESEICSKMASKVASDLLLKTIGTFFLLSWLLCLSDGLPLPKSFNGRNNLQGGSSWKIGWLA